MATNISEEEFIRLQNQLIELRTANYSLEEQYAVQVSKNKQLRLRVEALEKECNKVYSSINVSKKLKNSELIQQNEALQLKLQAQEDDFRLQNQTLLQELSTLVIENEKLGSKINLSASEAESASEFIEEVKQLRLEASALQRALSEERLRAAHEISKLKNALSHFTKNQVLQNDLCKENEELDSWDQEKNPCSSPKVVKEENADSETMLDKKDNMKKQESEETSPKIEILNEYQEEQNELHKVKLEYQTLKENYDLETQKLSDSLKAEKENNERLQASLHELQHNFDEYKVLSEKTISELGQKMELITDDQEKQFLIINDCNYQKNELEAQVQQLKKEIGENNLENEIVHSQLIESLKNIEQLKSNVSSLHAENQQLTKRLEEAKRASELRRHMMEEMAANNKQILTEYDNQIHQLENEKNLLEYKYKEQMETLMKLKSSLDIAEEANLAKEKQISDLEQQVIDLNAERSLSEKKGAVICRDLKRQLAAERRRVEKLQEKLHELPDTPMTKRDSSKGTDAEITSISSWSMMSGNMDPQESGAQESSLAVAGSPTNINGNIFSQPDETDLEHENRNLLERVTALQEEKWVLEEKINHLEQGSAAMAEDLMKKSEVIQFYCMEGRPDPQPSSTGKKTVKKISEFLKMSEEEHLHESNVRMQRMLEEMLTKNMYLQRDIEQMSKELETRRQTSKLQMSKAKDEC